MDREQARQEIRARISCKNYLEKSKGGLYCCPFCGSGKGKNKTGALKYYPETNTVCCFGKCADGDKMGKVYDVIDLYQKATGADYNTALSELSQQIGAEIDTDRRINEGMKKHLTEKEIAERNRQTGQNAPNLTIQGQNAQKGIIAPRQDKNSNTGKSEGADYTKYYEVCRARLEDPAAISYLSARGISAETAKNAGIGFDPEADPASAPGAMENERKPHPCPRLIIPTTPGHYVGRRIDGQAEFAKLNAAGSTPGIFNESAIYTQEAQEIMVFEGAFDALSALEVGAQAIALNSADNGAALISLLEQKPADKIFILCPDNDPDAKTKKAITKRFVELYKGLKKNGVTCIGMDVCASYKDANDFLKEDPESFKNTINGAIKKAHEAQEVTTEETPQEEKKPDSITDYIDTMMGQDMQNFKTDIKTGFEALDEKAGGLYTGLYVVAAISSLGKTTFVHQMGDQLAAAGNDVLFFSLEMSRLEMATKSISRIIKQNGSEKKITSLDIRKGRFAQEVREAIKQYKETVKDHFSVIEGNFDCNITFIGDYVKQYIKRNNTRPVIIIDYLQILQAETDSRGRTQTTKETMDTAITALKRLSRELNIIIFVVSSVNRANYQTPIDFESIKESGGIEYTADVIWGLQLKCLNEPIFNTMDKTKVKEKRERIKEAKAENPREIELVCLKNRYGIANFTCEFSYYPASDYFEGADPTDWKQVNEDFEKLPQTITRV